MLRRVTALTEEKSFSKSSNNFCLKYTFSEKKNNSLLTHHKKKKKSSILYASGALELHAITESIPS